MKYLVKEVNDIYVTWLSEVNRYVLFREPAFRVFQLRSEDKPEQEIIDETILRYTLLPKKAKRFVNEITEQVNALLDETDKKEDLFFLTSDRENKKPSPLLRIYDIYGIIVSISYGNSFIEENIHPRLLHLSDNKENISIDYTFTLTSSQGHYILEDGKEEKSSFKLVEELAGGLYLQLLNIIHGIPPASWMGVAHASAITDGKEAILFMAPSGGGKSTIAALMLANGFKLLSDDFVPIALNEPEVYSFPAGISVKETAIPFIKEYFPEIENLNITERPGLNKNGVFLPFPSDSLCTKNVKTKAIVFVQYDKSVDCRFKRSPNHELMEQFLVESWIANNPVAAGRFMDWFFNLEVYTLQYSDSKKAVTRIKKIFKD